MPTLIRFIVIVGIIVATVYGSMVALVIFVEPREREMSVPVRSERLQP
jgi:hypothetical protein